MSYPEGLPAEAFCMMEGCEWRGGSVCIRCGARLRCGCGRFVRSDAMVAHVRDCKWVDARAMEADEEARRNAHGGP